MATEEPPRTHNELRHITEMSAVLRDIENQLSRMNDSDFKREAILLVEDKNLHLRLLQLLLGEAEKRNVSLAHQLIDTAREYSHDAVLAEALKDIDATSPGA